ncbi:putative ABC transporter substrate-binding protein [Arthrobacter globiformis NBRC 12137]|uniref:Putative ABC transporter substrate-binding protein n=1 Tax=Arthrobacter globiformis (strain ATCC 8010 / DSM 20124 / JCM 1332 / NBRC 12137 / NCIMB 8907 / NRRL B-2979 / 168) TaxID=1077972 RepID=H0QKN3_ARTG1|nr:ABC transporter substrate-binding protein [Arthrobacter globiformis]GAB13232.1 putative ABC transporter substrate-binding protein [Arthrobacter globiformis NBRC 12137]
MTSSSKLPFPAAVLKWPALASVAVLGLSGCSVANSDAAALSSNTVRVVLGQEPPTLEACESNLTSTGVVVRSNVTEPLIERNPKTGELEPKLATEWKATSDTEWTLKLREGVKFQDGTPFNAEAAAFTIDRAVNSKLGCNVEGYVFGDADLKVKAVDASTLTVTTPEPDPILPLRLSFLEVVPTSTSTTAKVREPIGTGPYKIEQWDSGQKITLSTWDGYWGDKPAYAKAEYQWRSESSVRAAMVTSGEADVAMGLSPDDNIGDLGVDYPNNETVALRLDANAAPLNDIRVRQAVNYAIDKEGIVNSLYQGKHKVAAQLVPEGVVGHNSALTGWPFDLDKAKSLVAEAKADGVDTSKQISLVVRSAQFPKITELGQVLQEQLGQAGLNVKLKMLETSQHLTYQVRPFPKDEGAVALMTQHGNQAGDAAFTVDQYMLSTGAQSYFGTPEFDAMIKKADAASGDERKKDFEEIFAYQNDKVVQFAHISHQTGIIGKAKSVNYTPNSSSGDELRVAEMTPAS